MRQKFVCLARRFEHEAAEETAFDIFAVILANTQNNSVDFRKSNECLLEDGSIKLKRREIALFQMPGNIVVEKQIIGIDEYLEIVAPSDGKKLRV